MLSYKLFLDDERSPIACLHYHMQHMPMSKDIYLEDWIIVRNYEEFVKEIETRYEKGEFPWLISFDHDLAHEHYNADPNSEFREKTGASCAKWILDFCISHDIEIPKHYVHSQNYVGGNNIHETMNDFKRYKELMRKYPTRDQGIDY